MGTVKEFRTVAVTLTLALVVGCAKKPDAVATAPASVSVSQPVERTVGDSFEFTGMTKELKTVDVRARVLGFLKKVDFEDGSLVGEKQPLFEIEPETFVAEVDKAKANLQAAQARLEKAKADLGIKQEMAAGNAASKLDVIVATANVGTATADVASATAALEQANINLGYTKIFSPMSGRIDHSRVDTGNLVGADGNTMLANIVQMDPMYVYFDVDERIMQRVQARLIAQGITPGAQRPNLPFTLALGDSGTFSFQGKLDFVDNRVDPSTGTMRVRGVLANPTMVITPGYFARIRLPDGEPYKALLVPERSIGIDQGQKFLLVVNDKNVVEARPIEVGTQHGRMRVIQKGLAAGDWVITDALLRTRPGATVSPQRKPLPAADEPAAPATQATAATDPSMRP